MKYCSTRGGVRGLTFQDAILCGWASDGGILLPETIPQVPSEKLQVWSKLSYVELFKAVLPVFISEEEIPQQSINGELYSKPAARNDGIVFHRALKHLMDEKK